MDLSKQKKALLEAGSKAAKILMRYFENNPRTMVKKNRTFVSEADLKANDTIIKTIKKYFPDHNIISEETPEEKNHSDFTWVIDPLDGTHNFLHGMPIFGTSIALKHKKDVVLGLIIMPALGITLFSQKGRGAFVNGKTANVSKNRSLDRGFILFEFSFIGRDKKLLVLEKMANERFDMRNLGCAVYHLYLVASGKADAYLIHHSHEWDVAAGYLAVLEAGGKVTDMKGRKASSDTGNYVFSNGKIHKKIMRFLE